MRSGTQRVDVAALTAQDRRSEYGGRSCMSPVPPLRCGQGALYGLGTRGVVHRSRPSPGDAGQPATRNLQPARPRPDALRFFAAMGGDGAQEHPRSHPRRTRCRCPQGKARRLAPVIADDLLHTVLRRRAVDVRLPRAVGEGVAALWRAGHPTVSVRAAVPLSCRVLAGLSVGGSGVQPGGQLFVAAGHAECLPVGAGVDDQPWQHSGRDASASGTARTLAKTHT